VNDVGSSYLSDETSIAIAPLPSSLSAAPYLDQAESTISSLLVRWPSATTIPDDPTSIAITGYRLYMDGGNDGKFRLIFDGENLPGVLQYRVTSGILAGRAYRFKVSALNFNGEGEASAEALIYACLSPSNFSAPTYSSSTETSLTIEWETPRLVNGCPINKY
jgi:hypothetical protein